MKKYYEMGDVFRKTVILSQILHLIFYFPAVSLKSIPQLSKNVYLMLSISINFQFRHKGRSETNLKSEK